MQEWILCPWQRPISNKLRNDQNVFKNNIILFLLSSSTITDSFKYRVKFNYISELLNSCHRKLQIYFLFQNKPRSKSSMTATLRTGSPRLRCEPRDAARWGRNGARWSRRPAGSRATSPWSTAAGPRPAPRPASSTTLTRTAPRVMTRILTIRTLWLRSLQKYHQQILRYAFYPMHWLMNW